MSRTFTAIGIGIGLAAVTAGFLAFTSAPAQASSPNCVAGFSTIQKKSWILKCRRTVPMAQKGVALTQANNANCQPNSYWNYGPKVTAKTLRFRNKVRVTYICGHVEG